jgi:hypothetical protein
MWSRDLRVERELQSAEEVAGVVAAWAGEVWDGVERFWWRG